jgi:Uma2 family endonuclease
MQVVLPESRLSEAGFLAFCKANPDLWVERNAQGEITVVPPVGAECDHRCALIVYQLSEWSNQNQLGKVFGTTALFLLRDGSALCPDAAWMSNVLLSTLTKEQRRGFPRICPEFIVEVMSPSDRLPAAQRKMQTWIANGVELAWLIDGENRCVYVFRKNSEPERLSGIDRLAGEGPVAGFTLELSEIWEGL